MSGRLRSRLLGIGRAAGTRSESGGIRFFALALASLALTLAVAAVIAALAVETSRDRRMSDGHLVSAPSGPVLVHPVIDHLQGGRQYSVVYLSPVGDRAPLPPGLDHWPEPGTAVVSPELLRAGADQAIAGRYGEIAGTIGEPGLADATELLVYVRPAHDLSESTGAIAVSGFGGAGPVLPGQNVHWLLANQDFFPGTLVGLLVVLGVVPALLLALVASRVAAHSRDRRDALVTALGGRVHHRLWIAAGEAWAPVSLGVLGALAVITWFGIADRRLPIVDYVVPVADLRAQWWAFGLCALAAGVFVLSAAVLQSAIGGFGVGGNRPLRNISTRTRSARVALFPCFVLLAALGPYLFSRQQPAYMLAGYVGLIGTVLTMPAAIAVAVGALGRALAAHHRGRPALLTAGRRLAHRPETVARQVFGVSACVLFFLFALTMQGNFAGNAEEANAFVDEHGYSLVEVHPRGEATPAEVDAFVASVPLGVVAYTGSAHVHLTGTCPTLTALSLTCSAEQRIDHSSPLAAWLRSSSGGREPVLTVTQGVPSSALTEGTISLLAFTADGSDIPPGLLNNAGTAFPFGAATNVPGESWHTGSVPALEQSGWIALTGGFGIAVLILATGLGLAGEFLRFGKAIAPLSVLTGNRRIFWRASALVSLLPLTGAVAAGFLIGYPAVRPLATTGVNLITPTFITTCCVATLTAGTVVWLWSAAAATTTATTWHPTPGDD